RQSQAQRTPLERRLAARLKNTPVGECLSLEQILTLVREGRRAPNYYALMQHVITCTECRQAVLQARALVQAQRPSWARWLQRLALPRPLIWAPAVGVATVLLLFFVSYQRNPSQQQLALQPTNRQAEPAVSVAPHDAAGTTADTTRSGTAHPRVADSRLAQPPQERPPAPLSSDELQQAARYPSFVRDAVQILSQAAATLGMRSVPDAAAPPLEFTQPDLQRNISVMSQNRRFQWKPVPEALGYQFVLRRVNGSILAETTLGADQTEFTLDAPLPPAQYEVRLVAQLPDKTLSLRREFYVLNAELQQRYEWAQRHAEKSPLLCAAVFYQIDRFEDALRCIERAVQKYPNDPRVNRWREVIQTRLNLRLGEYGE
ncbi:MAG: hypothetical protein NZ556_08295, partial [Fimbriimonadales bacterium]|nr:hypothetical protein [Fimbriimonadales bacterium]